MARRKKISVSQTYKDIIFNSFRGMKNKGLESDARYPYLILNMDIYPDGSLRPRYKLKKIVDLPFAHSPLRLIEITICFFLIRTVQIIYTNFLCQINL